VIFFPTLLVCLPNNASSSGLTVLLVVPPVRLPRENEDEVEEGEEGYCVLKGSLSEQYKNQRTARGPTVTQFAAKQRK